MSYTVALIDFLHHQLNEFYDEYGQELSEDEVHEHALDYVTSDTLTFIKNLEQVAKYITDHNYVTAIEIRMSENDYQHFLFLADDAMSDVVWDYIISNY